MAAAAVPAWQAGLGFGTQVLGLFSGKGKGRGNAASRSIQDLLLNMSQRARGYDAAAEAENAAAQAKLDAEDAIRRAVAGDRADFAAEGSHGWLPDTARESTIRGSMTGIGRTLATFLADLRSKTMQRQLAVMGIPVGLAQAGRGENLQSNSQFNGSGFVGSLNEFLGSLRGRETPRNYGNSSGPDPNSPWSVGRQPGLNYQTNQNGSRWFNLLGQQG